MDFKQPVPGDVLVWHDPKGVPHNALRTVNWGTCINLVLVSGDENKKDQYGRQIEHQTSISHVSQNKTHGFNWRWPGEKQNPYTPPISA